MSLFSATNEHDKKCIMTTTQLFVLLTLLYFVQGNFQVLNVDESAAIGSKIHQLPTPGPNQHYVLYPWGDPRGLALFTITEIGQVMLKSKLSYEIGKGNSYYIIAVLRDKSKKYGGTAYTRKFEVMDSNDHSPQFAKKLYFGEIMEGERAGTVVQGLEDCFATDLDTSGILKYEITEGNNKNEFMVDMKKDVDGIKLLIVKTTGTIDRDEIRSTPYLDLEVRAHDGGVGSEQKFAKTVIRIKILDKNDNPPVFLYTNWQRSIQENAAVSSSVMRISASDNDEGQNAEVYYHFKELTDDFYINPSSGEISVASNLNVDVKKEYDLTVVAQDKAIIESKQAETKVDIQVLNVPNYPVTQALTPVPVFSKREFSVTIRGDLPLKSFIYFPQIKSGNDNLQFSLSGFRSSYFRISKKSGIITLQQKVNAAVKDKFDLRISVKNQLSQTDSMSLVINVQPLNQNKFNPVFDPSTQSVDIMQNINVNTEIEFTVQATDKDMGIDGELSYYIVGGSGMGRFAIADKTGKLTTQVIFKTPAVYDLYVRAQDNGRYKKYGTMYLRVNVQPYYNYAPVLSRTIYDGYIDEGEVQDSFVAAIFATSPGPGKKVTYELTGVSPQGLALDRDTGVITTTQPLDYEQEQYKFVEVEVRAQGVSKTTKTAVNVIIVNLNDNPPVFTRPAVTVNVNENAGDIPSLVCLFAMDEDGAGSSLSYSIDSGNIGNQFSINSQTGQLSVKNLDYESHESYTLIVNAADGVHQAKATVNVVVKDTPDPPHFENSAYTTVVDEGTTEDTVVKKLSIVTDKSDSHVCDWGRDDVSPEILALFLLVTESRSCTVKVKATGKIHWRRDKPKYQFSLRAINKNNRNQVSVAKLTVEVRDKNDNKPQFSQTSYAISIASDGHLGKSILKVLATDLDEGTNGRVSYDIQDGTDSNMFSINSDGDMFVKSVLDVKKEYKLKVNARNPGSVPSHSSADVIITAYKEGTVLPTFTTSTSSQTISESSSIGATVLKVAASGPNIQHEIVGGNENDVFTINADGLITLKKTLDFELRDTYGLIVRVKIPTFPGRYAEKRFTVKVQDSNDNSPVFSVQDPLKQQKVYVDQYSPDEAVIARFKAYDADSGSNGQVSYKLIGDVPFSIDSTDGTITTTSEVKSAVGTKYEFQIQATDAGKTSSKSATLSVSVEIKAGTKVPVFTQKLFRSTSLADEVTVGSQAASVVTTDTDSVSTATFKISSGNPNDSFCIDSTKIVYVQRPLDFDVNHITRYTLNVEMTYGYQTSQSTVMVNVVDDNDNSPVFTNGKGPIVRQVSEAKKAGYVLYTAKATDKDSGNNGKVSYSIVQVNSMGTSINLFKIDETSGELSLVEQLNFESRSEHIIIIKAEDSGSVKRYTLQEIRVEVIDENDERPTFSEKTYVGYIPRNEKPGYQVLKVFAADFDSGKYGRVVYSIIGSNYDNTFSIGKSSGIITLKKPIALIDSKEFTLTIKAQDISMGGQGIVKLYAITTEGAPKFALIKFVFNVTENNKPSEKLGSTKAISLDLLTYSIARGNIDNMFRINERNGKLYSTKPLDAETRNQYVLYVRATDLSERYAEASVEVNVLNVNDNGPKFKNTVDGVIEVVKSRSLAVGQIVATIDGYDLDVGDKLTYKIVSYTAKKYFQIDQLKGVVTSVRSLEDLAKSTNQYLFEIAASDRAGQKKSVKVHVILIRRRGETFIRSVSEAQDISSAWFITNIDYLGYTKASFKIIYPSDNPFKIDFNKGYIGLERSVDYEKRKQYVIYVEETDRQRLGEYSSYKIQINVIDANDNRPIFTMKNLIGKVNKNAQPGTKVFTLTADDPDDGNAGEIYFEIKGADPFSIDPLTNEIKTAGFQLSKDWYNITVQAHDKGRPPKSSDLVKVCIKTGDNPPEFAKDLYRFNVKESSQTGLVVGTVSARSLSGISIQYSIEGGNQENIFTIDSLTGKIILQGNLDFESGQSSYSLTVQAAEISTQPLISTSNVVIQVVNVNDNPPEFNLVEYRSPSISENVPIGTTLVTVTATDCDCSQTCKCAGGLLFYSVEKYKDTFKIDHVTGEITNIRPLDYDTVSEYRFQVRVHDSGDNPGVADVVITLSNVNDNSPVFSPDSGSASLAEDVVGGTIIITVQAQDLDGDTVTYAIESGDKNNFEIVEKTGVVRVTTKRRPVFYNDKYVLNISASDDLNKGYFTLTVTVEDVNDNIPVFRQCSSYKPWVTEQSAVNTFVIRVAATDTDRGRNGEIEYFIQEPQKANKPGATSQSDFKINNATGVISTNDVFDREKKSSYIVLVIALDGGHGRSPAERNSASCQLEIQVGDVNDHTPVFIVQNYDISIAEETEVNTVVVEVSAQDKDEGRNAEIIYSIKQGELTPEFKIDSKTGEISVAKKLEGEQKLYSFQVVATDNGSPPRSNTIKVDINVEPSNPPKFTLLSYAVNVKEDTKPGAAFITVKAISQVKEDPEKKIYYSILPGNLPSTNKPPSFIVDSKTGEIRVAKVLDYETLREYVLTVSAVDSSAMKSNVKVYINIIDVNDNTPIFVLSKYDFGKVAEGKKIGQVVEQVNATDADSGLYGQVEYSLGSSKEADMFDIDPVTGKITTKVVFDREITPKITFNVKAKDKDPKNSLSSVTYVTIQVTDVNDNSPVFDLKSYKKIIEENAKVGSNVVEIKATDKDAGENAKLNYYIISGNEKGYFGTKSIHRADGESIGFVTVARKLDREDKNSFELRLIASDSQFRAECTVNITVKDVNDNNPIFARSVYNSTIPESTGTSISIAQVTATDRDTPAVQKQITYKLAQEADGYFVIDQNTGKITTGAKGFDREVKSVYTFLVFASDGTRTGSATVKVVITDVNDEKPEFSEGPYIREVREKQNPGAKVGFVTAKDKDQGTNALITYSLLQDEGKFTIDVNTGLIRTKEVLDRESEDSKFVITVAATDQGKKSLQGKVDVTILVTDANDQYPYFKQETFATTMKECADIGERVTQMRASDNDIGLNAEIIYAITSGNTPRRFRIDPDTGVITVAHRLNFEKERGYKLFISVRDKGIPQLISKRNASVTIIMEDCNDNPPVFSKSSYAVSVYENVQINYELITIDASDSDSGNNGKFEFFIVDPDENYQFRMEPGSNASTGIVVLNWRLDREKQNQHILTIGARDFGTPQLKGYAQLVVNVLDVNDNPPKFEPSDFCGTVMENSKKVQTVANIRVTDPDDKGNQCPCKFQIVNDPTGGKFVLESLPTGDKAVIKTVAGAVFDREELGKQMYKLTISASDSGTRKMMAETFVYVEVGDQNDNRPTSNGKLEVLVNAFKGKFKGGPVSNIYVVDPDRGRSDQYTHSLISSAEQNMHFSIDVNGQLIAKSGIPSGTFQLQVRSTEKKTGSTVTSEVQVKVRQISEKLIQSSLPIRMFNVTKDLTCKELKYPDFEGVLAKIVGVDVSQVMVFSVIDAPGIYRGVDIWFSVIKKKGVTGFPGDQYLYYDAMELLVKLSEFKYLIERATGGKVLSIGIDSCAKETCTAGFCANQIQGLSSYTIVTDENGVVPAMESMRSFVSIDLQVVAICAPEPSIPDACTKTVNPCLNGGTCTAVQPKGFFCSCLKGYDGPRCESTTRHIKRGGYFWLKPLSYFYSGELSFEFTTTQANGLLLYQGPISTLSKYDVIDFLAVDLFNSKLRISVTQGEEKVFQKTLTSGKPLNDGKFHHVLIIKKGKFIKIVVDRCDESEIIESKGNEPVRNTETCSKNGTIPGKWRFINGIYPLQFGAIKYETQYIMKYAFAPFEGCIGRIIDNGAMYDMKFPLLQKDSELGCPSLTVNCPVCYNGVCDIKQTVPVCKCHSGWYGKYCSQRVVAFQYLSRSFSQYTIKGNTGSQVLNWYDKYISDYKVQFRTTSGDAYVIYESSRTTSEYSILEIKNYKLQYKYNLGDGESIITLEGVNVTDGRWHDIALYRRGEYARLTVSTNSIVVGSVEGREGTHRLLDSNGIIYVGGILDTSGGKSIVLEDFQGCMAHLRYKGIYLDNSTYAAIYRESVDRNCSCSPAVLLLCTVGSVCMPGAPPYCSQTTGPVCPGPGCVKKDQSKTSSPEVRGFVILAVIVMLFLLSVLLIALFMSGVMKKKKEPIYVDVDGRDNIMQYNEEGAGEDDFFNYDLEKLLQHAGGRGLFIIDDISGGGGAGGGGACSSSAAAGKASGMGEADTEPLLHSEAVFLTEASIETNMFSSSSAAAASASVQTQSAGGHAAMSLAEEIDVAAFISSNLATADSEDAAYPRDTLLHYGYEGEGSDVDDLSELDDSDSEDEDEDEFAFLSGLGPEFKVIRHIYYYESDDDV